MAPTLSVLAGPQFRNAVTVLPYTWEWLIHDEGYSKLWVLIYR